MKNNIGPLVSTYRKQVLFLCVFLGTFGQSYGKAAYRTWFPYPISTFFPQKANPYFRIRSCGIPFATKSTAYSFLSICSNAAFTIPPKQNHDNDFFPKYLNKNNDSETNNMSILYFRLTSFPRYPLGILCLCGFPDPFLPIIHRIFWKSLFFSLFLDFSFLPSSKWINIS